MKWLGSKQVKAEESPYKIIIPITATWAMSGDIYDWEEYLESVDKILGTEFVKERKKRIKDAMEMEIEKAKDQGGEEAVEMINEDQITEQIENDIYEEIVKEKGEIDISSIDSADEALDAMVEDFNKSELEQYIHDEKLKAVIKSIRMIVANPDSAIVEVNTTRDLESGEMGQLLQYIDGQCSDGWGEGFEQQDFKLDKIGYFNLHTWTSKGPGAELVK